MCMILVPEFPFNNAYYTLGVETRNNQAKYWGGGHSEFRRLYGGRGRRDHSKRRQSFFDFLKNAKANDRRAVSL